MKWVVWVMLVHRRVTVAQAGWPVPNASVSQVGDTGNLASDNGSSADATFNNDANVLFVDTVNATTTATTALAGACAQSTITSTVTQTVVQFKAGKPVSVSKWIKLVFANVLPNAVKAVYTISKMAATADKCGQSCLLAVGNVSSHHALSMVKFCVSVSGAVHVCPKSELAHSRLLQNSTQLLTRCSSSCPKNSLIVSLVDACKRAVPEEMMSFLDFVGFNSSDSSEVDDVSASNSTGDVDADVPSEPMPATSHATAMTYLYPLIYFFLLLSMDNWQ
ncbi:hypothetical protein BC830DRAFT_1088615 [Chytriomyces sp. MP71]|nr:hypothetical protein BC830DRAFT_1088615 [Chytriomyces sp. MP71]